MWKWILATTLFALIVVELVFFAPSTADREIEATGQEDAKKLTQDVEQVISGIHLVEAEGEKKSWELEADKGTKKKGKNDWVLDAVDVKFFGEKGVFYTAVGKNGYVGDNQKQLKIEGDIVINSSNGYVLDTEVIFYRTDNRTIDGPNHVNLKGPREKSGDGGPLFMEADHFDANLNTNIINLIDNVKGRKLMSGGRKMRISSREAQFSGQSNFVLFKKDVVMHVDSMTVTGPRAKFIYKDNELYSLLIDGGVKIKDIGRWGLAGQAEVFFKEDKYIFRGSPKVVQADDQLVGDIITLYDGGDRVRVEKAKTRYNVKENGETGF